MTKQCDSEGENKNKNKNKLKIKKKKKKNFKNVIQVKNVKNAYFSRLLRNNLLTFP